MIFTHTTLPPATETVDYSKIQLRNFPSHAEFKFDINSLSVLLYKKIQSKQFLNDDDIRAVATEITGQLFNIETRISRDTLARICLELARDHPESFLVKGASFPEHLLAKMINRRNYLRQSSPSPAEVSSNKSRKQIKLQNTVVAFEPNFEDDDPIVTDVDGTLVSKQLWLQKNRTNFADVEREEKIDRYMNDTFRQQRIYINNINPSKFDVQKIKDDWPFLLDSRFIRLHFWNQCQVKLESFSKNFPTICEKTIKYFKKQEKYAETDISIENSSRKLLQFLADAFKEDLSYFYGKFNVSIISKQKKDREKCQ